jgi:hypothetical protein
MAALDRLYREISGFGPPGRGPDGRRLRQTRGLTYGELTARGIFQLIRATGLGPADHFFDLGSGTGRVVLQVALTVPGVRCTGIEIDGTRHDGAVRTLEEARALGLVDAGRITLRHEDLQVADLAGATVLFAHATCYPATLLRRLLRRIATLPPPVLFASLRPPGDDLPRRFVRQGTRRCATSWDARQTLHLYRLGPAGPTPAAVS